MQLVLPPDAEAFVQEQLNNGNYLSPTDVVLAAIQLLKQKTEGEEDIYKGRLAELQNDVRVGWEAYQNGETVDGATAIARIKADLRGRKLSYFLCTHRIGNRNIACSEWRSRSKRLI